MELSRKGQVVLVMGPARSGKSEWAEAVADLAGKTVVYVATSQIDPSDLEWQARIEKHRQRRPDEWQTVESSDLAEIIQSATELKCLLIDSLGTWLANCLEQDDMTWNQNVQTLLAVLESAQCDVIFVAEETGWGVVPAYPIGRQFRDRLGSLVRQVAAVADAVHLVTAGHILDLSKLGIPLSNALDHPTSFPGLSRNSKNL